MIAWRRLWPRWERRRAGVGRERPGRSPRGQAFHMGRFTGEAALGLASGVVSFFKILYLVSVHAYTPWMLGFHAREPTFTARQ